MCGRGVQNPRKGGNGVEGKTSPEVKKQTFLEPIWGRPGKSRTSILLGRGEQNEEREPTESKENTYPKSKNIIAILMHVWRRPGHTE